MPYADSAEKIIRGYLANVCRQAFEFKGHRYPPRPLRVSPLIFRGFTCPARCGGCCPRFSLDYLPTELQPAGLNERALYLDGKEHIIRSDRQSDNVDHFCRHLVKKTGRCGIYEARPFSCDFELIRFIVPRYGPVHLTQKLFGRGWAMRRVDGRRGAKCEMLSVDKFWQDELIRKLSRLREWAIFFGISTCLDEVIEWTSAGPHNSPLYLPATK